jgi:hypothetical protein
MPTSIRTVGVAVSYIGLHITIIVLVQITPIALASISWRYFLIFVISSGIYIFIFYFFYPETKGKTLEELEGIFGDKVS